MYKMIQAKHLPHQIPIFETIRHATFSHDSQTATDKNCGKRDALVCVLDATNR